jgi:hypothetical protein
MKADPVLKELHRLRNTSIHTQGVEMPRVTFTTAVYCGRDRRLQRVEYQTRVELPGVTLTDLDSDLARATDYMQSLLAEAKRLGFLSEPPPRTISPELAFFIETPDGSYEPFDPFTRRGPLAPAR